VCGAKSKGGAMIDLALDDTMPITHEDISWGTTSTSVSFFALIPYFELLGVFVCSSQAKFSSPQCLCTTMADLGFWVFWCPFPICFFMIFCKEAPV
jgi:hypothetical protein